MLMIVLAQIIAGIQVVLQQAIILQVAKEYYSVVKSFLSVFLLMSIYAVVNQYLHAYSVLTIAIWILLLVLSYRFIFKQSVQRSVLMGIGQMVLTVSVDYIGLFIITLAGEEIQKYVYSNQVYIRIATSGILLLIYAIVRKYSFVLSPVNPKKESKALWIVYITYLLLFSLPKVLEIESNQRLITSDIELYNLFLFILFFVYNVLYVRGINKMSNIAQQLEVQQLYSETLEKSIRELRGFKHDFANILNTIGGFVDIGDCKSLQDYMRNLNIEFLSVCTTDIVNTRLKSNPILYGVVLSKLSLAELNGVEFAVFIQDDIAVKYCDPVDLSRMVGILLDNALEAAVLSSQKHVELSITSSHERNQICIHNTYTGSVDLDKIFNEQYTTKENHSGVGLSHVLAIIRKYRSRGYAMELKTYCKDGLFTQALTI